MLSRETIELCRRMTVGERLKLTLEAIDVNAPYLLHGPPNVVGRRFESIQRENDLRNFDMLTATARARTAENPLEMQIEDDTPSSRKAGTALGRYIEHALPVVWSGFFL